MDTVKKGQKRLDTDAWENLEGRYRECMAGVVGFTGSVGMVIQMLVLLGRARMEGALFVGKEP